MTITYKHLGNVTYKLIGDRAKRYVAPRGWQTEPAEVPGYIVKLLPDGTLLSVHPNFPSGHGELVADYDHWSFSINYSPNIPDMTKVVGSREDAVAQALREVGL